MLKTIQELKQLTVKSEQLSVPANYFLENIAENSAIAAMFKPAKMKPEFLKTLFKPIMQQFGNADISSVLSLEFKKAHLVHGAVILSDAQLIVFYFFHDIQMGLAITHARNLAQYFRLSLFKTENCNLDQKIIPVQAPTTWN